MGVGEFGVDLTHSTGVIGCKGKKKPHTQINKYRVNVGECNATKKIGGCLYNDPTIFLHSAERSIKSVNLEDLLDCCCSCWLLLLLFSS